METSTLSDLQALSSSWCTWTPLASFWALLSRIPYAAWDPNCLATSAICCWPHPPLCAVFHSGVLFTLLTCLLAFYTYITAHMTISFYIPTYTHIFPFLLMPHPHTVSSNYLLAPYLKVLHDFQTRSSNICFFTFLFLHIKPCTAPWHNSLAGNSCLYMHRVHSFPPSVTS